MLYKETNLGSFSSSAQLDSALLELHAAKCSLAVECIDSVLMVIELGTRAEILYFCFLLFVFTLSFSG